MSATLFIIVYNNWSTTAGEVIAGTISGTTITLTADASTSFDTGDIKFPGVSKLDGSRFVIAYCDDADGDKGRVIVGCVAANRTITIVDDGGTLFESGRTYYPDVCAMDDTYFVIAFNDLSDTNDGKVIAGSDAPAASTSIKTALGTPIADFKTLDGIALADLKSWLTISNVG